MPITPRWGSKLHADSQSGMVVTELQRRGLFRREYEGRTLRENLGLKRPERRIRG